MKLVYKVVKQDDDGWGSMVIIRGPWRKQYSQHFTTEGQILCFNNRRNAENFYSRETKKIQGGLFVALAHKTLPTPPFCDVEELWEGRKATIRLAWPAGTLCVDKLRLLWRLK